MELPSLPDAHGLAVLALIVIALFLFTRERIQLETSSLAVLVLLAVGFELFPYSHIGCESNTRIYKCKGWNPHLGKSVHIFTLRNTAWPGIEPRFEYKTDWLGRVILHVTDGRDKTRLPVERTYYLPSRRILLS